VFELFVSLGNIVISMQKIESIFQLKYFHKGLLGTIGVFKAGMSVIYVYD